MQTDHKLTAKMMKLSDLREHPDNARRGDVEAIRASLRVHGQFIPIVAQQSTGYVIKGNHTFRGMLEEGWTRGSVIVLDVDDDQARRIMLVDNRSSDLGGYEEDSLTALLTALGDDLTGTGYDPGDLDARLAELAISDTQKPSASDAQDAWAAKDARTVLLTYSVNDHQALCAKLDRLADQMGVDTYSDVVKRLVEDAS